MERGLILIAVSERGIQKVRVYHPEQETGILGVYTRILPSLRRMEKVLESSYPVAHKKGIRHFSPLSGAPSLLPVPPPCEGEIAK